jgi:hypothetical protein
MLAFEGFTAVENCIRINILPPSSGREDEDNRPVLYTGILTVRYGVTAHQVTTKAKMSSLNFLGL